MKRKYVDTFKHDGKLRLKLQSEYRKEPFPTGDADEGRNPRNIGPGTNFTQEESQKYFGVLNSIHIGARGTLVARNILPDAYILSCSTKEKLEKFSYDSYFSIFNVKKFADLIADDLSRKLNDEISYEYKSVEYKIINIGPNNKHRISPYAEDYFIKSSEFSDEDEYRFVFIPKITISLPKEIFINFTKKDKKLCCIFR